MKKLLLISLFLITACNSSNELKEGRWTGHLTPMNHPEMELPVSYDVTYKEKELSITITGPDSIPVRTHNPYVESDTLFFSFNEPEEKVLLDCALAVQKESEFVGRCEDSSGKWARFTMVSPD